MPFYVGDYLRDTGRLSTEGHGAYMLLIMDYWTSGKPLPDDDTQLAAITKMTRSAWKKLRPIVAGFFQIADGLWRHKRIDDELANAARVSSIRSEAGKRAVQERERGRSQRAVDNTKRAVHNPCITSPNDTPNDHQTIHHPISQSQSQVPKDLSKRVDELIHTLGGKRRFPVRRENFDDPAVRKARWQQKIEAEINRRLPTANAQAIIAGYIAGEPDAIEFYETVDRSLKDRRERA